MPQIRPQKVPLLVDRSQPRYLPHPWSCPTYDAKRHRDPIRRFLQCTGQTDARMHVRTYRLTSFTGMTTIGRCAMRAMQPYNNKLV